MDLLSKYNKSIGLDWESAEEAKYYYNRAIVKDFRGDNVVMKGGTMESRNEYVPARIIKKDNVWSIKEESEELIKAVMSFDEPVEAQITIEYKEEVLILRGRAEINNDYVNIIEPKVTPTTIMSNQTWTNTDTWRAVDSSHISTGTISSGMISTSGGSGGSGTITIGTSGGTSIHEHTGWTSGNLRVDQGSVSINSGGVWHTAQAVPSSGMATFYMNGQHIPAEIQTINAIDVSDQGNVYDTDGDAPSFSSFTSSPTISGTFQIDPEAFSRLTSALVNGMITSNQARDALSEIINEGED